MIKTLKKQSYKDKNPLNPQENFSPFRIVFILLLFIFLYLYLPAYFVTNQNLDLKWLFAFYLVNIMLGLFLLNKHSQELHRIEAENEDLQEAINILDDRNVKEALNSQALQEKIERYNTLKKIIEEINQNLDLNSVADSLCSIAFSLIGRNQGFCILYLIDSLTQKPALFKAKKEDKKIVLKAKEGDIFDFWVLRHTTPLLIDDIRKDFRFDLEKIKEEEQRPIFSLICAPFISEQRFLGLLRLDSPQPKFYSKDDLRFLVTISDIGAVALENAELFQKTQDLAIHDGLTSLYTKGYFLERLADECKRSSRLNRIFSLSMLDIDHFKNYNDQFGHTAGDILLKELSRQITEFFQHKSVIISRFGGEEFCVVLLGTDKKEAYAQAEELRLKIEKKKIILRRNPTGVTVSIGVAAFPVDASDEDELVLKADRAMYEAKQKGRNRVVLA